ncbi:aminotransferase class I/II-fold pyridoxal phosphate-dependent enzyme [Actinomyces sp. ZJ308]|uniref:MalY/PatB family protein n=1 Tax=Actinomyces sp. ZJ308 TaxID=2708342 RepID=UPI00141EED48|nr:aminotransferase class I/II-fold pyridoxal phosphate-dependent enzyme [Actinomyces sp. ZJ308]
MVVSDASGSSSLVQVFDSLTPQQMRERGSLKWSQYPGDVIGAWVAEMDLGTAPAVEAAIRQAMHDGLLGYMPPSVSEAAREETARYQRETFDWQVGTEQVSLLPDVLSSLSAVITSHTREGSSVIVPTPAYMPFLEIPGRNGRECIEVPSLTPGTAEGPTHWELDLGRIESAMAAGAGLLVLCNPWNPVGRVLTTAELDAVAALSSSYGVPVFADEIHAPLVLDEGSTHVPYATRPGSDPDLTFTATAASKGWNIPGLKCAQLIASGRARQQWDADAASSHLKAEASVVGALATIAALRDGRDWLDEVRAYIRANRDVVGEALGGIEGVEPTLPEATYLAWLDCRDLGLEQPARFFRKEAGVAMNEGVTFGAAWSGFCRLNLATGRRIEEETMHRIGDAVRRLRPRAS